MIGWFRKWWPWGRKARSDEWEAYCTATYRCIPLDGHSATGDGGARAYPREWAELQVELDQIKNDYKRAIKAKKKRSHIEARMKEIRTELLRMETGK